MIKIVRTVIICITIYLSIGKLSTVSAKFFPEDRRLIETSLQEIKTELHLIQVGLRRVVKSNDNIANEVHHFKRNPKRIYLRDFKAPVVYKE